MAKKFIHTHFISTNHRQWDKFPGWDLHVHVCWFYILSRDVFQLPSCVPPFP